MKRVLIVEGTNKVIKDREYESQNIEILILKEGIVKIGKKAFFNNDIKKLFLPKSLEEIDYDSIDGNNVEELIIYSNFTDFKAINPSDILYEKNHLFPIINYRFLKVKTLTIIDADYNYMKLFFSKYVNLFDDEELNKIVIINPKLSFFEKIAIKKLCKSKNITVEFSNSIDLNNLFNVGDLTNNQNDDEVNKLINKILNMISSLDANSKKMIEDKIKSLIEEYQEKLKNTRPEFALNDSTLNLMIEDTSPRSLKRNLILPLEIIIQNLNTKSRILEFSKKLNQYQLFLSDSKNINIENSIFANDKDFDKIKKIIELSEFLEETKFKDRLSDLFNKIQMMITENLKDKNIIELTLENQDVEKLFENYLNDLFQEVKSLNDKLLPYIDFLKVLQGYQNDLELSIELRQLEYVFSSLIGKTKDELDNLYKNIKNKYIDIVNDIILKIKNGEEVISSKEIEINLRKEIQPILKEIQQKLPNILKIQKLYHQLSIASSKETKEKGAIIDIVKEIRKLSDNSLLNSATKDIIIDKLSHILIHWEYILCSKDTSEIEKNFNSGIGLTSENLIIEVMILKELSELKLSLEEYLNKIQEYNEYSTEADEYSTEADLFNSSQIVNGQKAEESKSFIEKKQTKDIKSKYDYECLNYYDYARAFNIDING